MNILYIAQSCNPYNGSEDQIGWSTPWENAKNDQIYVVTRSDLRKPIEKFLSCHEKRNIHFYYVDIPSAFKKVFKGFLFSGRLLAWNNKAYSLAKRICEENDIDIIHQVSPVEYRSIGPYGKIENTKFVCGPIAGGQFIPNELYSYVKGKNRLIENIRKTINYIFRYYLNMIGRYNSCDYVLFANNETRQFLGEKKFIGKSSIFCDVGISENSIDFNASNRLEMKRQSSIDEPIHFLVAGRLICIKGIDFLFDALEQLPKSMNYKCRIVGDGDLIEHVKVRANQLVLKDKIEVLGRLPYEEMDTQYDWADVLLFPSFREACGTVIIEALSRAVPVVAMKRFGAAVILNSENSWMYTGNSKHEYINNLKCAISDCINNREAVLDKSYNAFQDAQKHTWDKKVAYYKDIYNNLLEK